MLLTEATAAVYAALIALLSSILTLAIGNIWSRIIALRGSRRNLVGIMRELAVWSESVRNELKTKGSFGPFAEEYKANIRLFLDEIRKPESAKLLSDEQYEATYRAAVAGIVASFANKEGWALKDQASLVSTAIERLEVAQHVLGDNARLSFSPW